MVSEGLDLYGTVGRTKCLHCVAAQVGRRGSFMVEYLECSLDGEVEMKEGLEPCNNYNKRLL
jgi:hypothetical protein